jgi:hypothetical protein
MESSLRETIEAASFAEKELELILGEIELQNEKLVNVQQKAGVAHSHLIQNSKLIDGVFKATKSRLAIYLLLLLIVLWITAFIKLRYFYQ